MEFEFLTIDDVLFIHQDQIDRYGGEHGLRDAGLLASAVETARATFNGELLHADLFQVAAAYMFHLVCNHPFMDGNKRVGTAAALVFFDWHGIELNVSDEELAEFVIALASSQRTKAQVAAFLQLHSRQIH